MSKKVLFAVALSLVAIGQRSAYAQDQETEGRELDEVVVTATKMNLPLKEIPQKVEIIDRSRIENIPAESLAELLKKVTPLNIIQYPGSSARIGVRGFSPTAHNRAYSILLIDGKPAGTSNLLSMPTEFVERIEIVKGPYAVLYGSDAMGGVINVITRRPGEELGGTASVSYGSFGRTEIMGQAEGSLSENVRLSLGASTARQTKDYKIGAKNLLPINDVEKAILDNKSYGDVMDNTKTAHNQFIGMLDVDFSDFWSGSFTASYLETEGLEMPGNYWHSYGLQSMDFSRLNVLFDLKRESETNTLTFSPYYSDYLEKNYVGTVGSKGNYASFKSGNRSYGLKLYDTQRWGDFTLLAGVDLDAENATTETFSAPATPSKPYRPDYNSLSSAIYLQGTYSIEQLKVNAGLRYTFAYMATMADERLKNEEAKRNISNLSPGLGIKYFILPSLNFHGSFGTAFYLPDAYQAAGEYKTDWASYKGNPDLRPETSLSYDFGINYNYGRIFNVDVTFFQTHYKDKIVNDYTNKEFTTFKNADKGLINGLEVMLSTDLAPLFDTDRTLELYANYTHLFRANFDTPLEGDKVLTQDLLYLRKDMGSFGIHYDDGSHFSTLLNARLVGHRFEKDMLTTPENKREGKKESEMIRPGITSKSYTTDGGYEAKDRILRHPQHLIFDYSISYRLDNGLKLGVTVSNLFDENYTEKDGYNMPGRALMGKISYTF